MKKILMAVLSGFLAISATAQTITLTFNGANSNINYQVLLDGNSYYSNSSTYPTNVRKEVALTNQRLGNHKIVVYRLRSNSGTYRNGINTRTYGNAIYSKTFVLREGYDMNIRVNGNGRVSFSESDIENLSGQGNNEQNNIMVMSDVRFEQLLQNVRSKYLQSSKITVERNAFLTRSNYFTTEQVSQLLSLISSEANRLALAKVAYPRVSDPTNFTQLYEVFTSENSKDEMNVFIRNNPNNNNNGNWENNNTKAPMANYQFSQLLQKIKGQYSQGGKFNIISGAFSNNSNYFSTAQIRQMLSLISGESDRLALAKLSYARVYDAAKFPTLYDLLYSQSSRNDLNNYVIQNGGTGSNVQNNSRIPMADASFALVLQKVSNHFLPWDKVRDARDAFNNTSYYFSTSQIRQILTVISSEADRLELAKLSWSRVTDPSNFTQLYDLFANQASKDEMNVFIRNNPNNNSNNNNNNSNWENNNTKAPMANYQFSQLLQTIKSQYYQDGKFNIISGAFNNNSNYFSTAQIRQMLSLINAENDRLSLAKLSYARVYDAANFSNLYDLLYSQSSRNDLNNYVIQNGGTGSNVQSNTRTEMADYQFNQLLQNVNNQWNQAGKFDAINSAFNTSGNYFTASQVRQLLSLVNSESDRLALAKLSYLRVTDPANFTSLYDLLNNQSSRNDLNNYVIQNGGTGTTVQSTSRIQMSDALFNQLYQKAGSHIRPSSTIDDLREFFNNSSYNFSTAQIRQLLSLVSKSLLSPLSSETDLLEVAKLSWHRVTDPANFTQLFSLFTIQANRDALNAYIQARPY